MELDTAIQKRKSVRSFKNKKVKWDHVLEMIDAANQAPFASNLNNLKYIIIEERETIDKIAELCDQLWMNESDMIVVVCQDDKNMRLMHEDFGERYSDEQAGAAVENFLLKSVDLGIGACWIGSFDEGAIKGLLGVPDDRRVKIIISLGYEKGNTPRKKKKSLESTIFWEKWDVNRRPEFIKEPKPKIP